MSGMTGPHLAALIVMLVIAIVAPLGAAEPSFTKDIGPLLVSRCSNCHGTKRQKNDLRLDSAQAIQKGGKNGAVVVAGSPDKSPIFLRTTKPKDDADRMPATGDMLTKPQTELIRAWIAAGAKFD